MGGTECGSKMSDFEKEIGRYPKQHILGLLKTSWALSDWLVASLREPLRSTRESLIDRLESTRGSLIDRLESMRQSPVDRLESTRESLIQRRKSMVGLIVSIGGSMVRMSNGLKSTIDRFESMSEAVEFELRDF